MGPDLQSRDPRLAGVLDMGHCLSPSNPVISKQRKWSSQQNRIVRECDLLSEPKVRGYRKCMPSLWLNKGMFWVSEQRPVGQANTIHKNSWMTELEIGCAIEIGCGIGWHRGVLVITTAKLHSTKPELWFCAGSNPACCMLGIHDGEDL